MKYISTLREGERINENFFMQELSRQSMTEKRQSLMTMLSCRIRQARWMPRYGMWAQ